MKKFYPSIIFIILLAFTSVSNAMDGGSSSEAPRHQSIRKHIFGIEFTDATILCY